MCLKYLLELLAAVMTKDGNLIQGYGYVYCCCVDDEINCCVGHGNAFSCDDDECEIPHIVVASKGVWLEIWMVLA